MKRASGVGEGSDSTLALFVAAEEGDTADDESIPSPRTESNEMSCPDCGADPMLVGQPHDEADPPGSWECYECGAYGNVSEER